MIQIRRAVVTAVVVRHEGLLDVTVTLDDAPAHAVAFPGLCGPLAPGDTVVLNTTAVSLGLGTGGVHFVIAVEGAEVSAFPPQARAMKLRYTPLQAAVEAAEESGRMPERLDGTPVVAAGLHSAIAPVAIGIAHERPDTRVGLVLTDAAALPAAFSDVVAGLRDAGLIAFTVTCGQALGGDVEAVNKFSAMLAAEGRGAEVIVVAMGPGNLGTGSTYGFASMEVAEIVNAAAALGGHPIVVPRIGFSDARERHRGVSHHTLTALGAPTYVPATIALPSLDPDRDADVRAQLEVLNGRLTIEVVDTGAVEPALKGSPVPLRTMGRSYEEEPWYFRAAAAAGILAARTR